MNPEIFEAIMMICFGVAWPFSIAKILKTKKANGKSVPFLCIVLFGYVSGVLFQYFGKRNGVIFLYLLNMLMVGFDLLLTLKYGKSEQAAAA